MLPLKLYFVFAILTISTRAQEAEDWNNDENDIKETDYINESNDNDKEISNNNFDDDDFNIEKLDDEENNYNNLDTLEDDKVVKSNPDEMEDDLIIPPVGRNGLTSPSSRWPGKTIPYVFEGLSAKRQSLIRSAMDSYQRQTCIKFRPKQNRDRDYISIKEGAGCSSYLGRVGGKQDVTLHGYCFIVIGSIYHELMHAIGFGHEQNRHDRDNYVKINLRNVRKPNRHNFIKMQGTDFGLGYDFGSIMHYSPHSFAIDDRKPTIIPIKPVPNGVTVGQRQGPSTKDIEKINRMYKCFNKPKYGAVKPVVRAPKRPATNRRRFQKKVHFYKRTNNGRSHIVAPNGKRWKIKRQFRG